MTWQSHQIFNDASFPVSFGQKHNKSVVLSLNVVFFQSYHIENRGFGLVAIEEQQCMAWQSYQIFNDASFPVSFGLIPDHHHHHVHYGPLSPPRLDELRQAQFSMNSPLGLPKYFFRLH